MAKAFQIIKPYLYIFLAFLQAGFTSGIIYGWPSLEEVFIKRGIYRSHCKPDDPANVACQAQSDFYNIIYTAAVFVNNAAPLITGLFLDRIGPKWTSIGSALLFFIGCGLFAVPSELVYVPAFALLGLAGPGIYCSIMHLCNLFPGHQASVLSFFSGTFSASSFIFRVFALIYKPNDKWRSMESIFIEYIVLLSPLFIIGAFIWPNKAFEAPGKKSLVDAEPEYEPLVPPSERITNAKTASLYNVDYKTQFKSALYWIPVLWLAFEALNISCYIATVQTRFPKGNMSSVFTLIWSFGWVSIPAFGFMMDKFGNYLPMNVTSVGLVIFNILKLIPYHPLQYASFVLVSTVNVGMWAIFYSYLSSKFGFDNYGKLLGVSSITTALIGALQYGFEWVTNNKLHGNFFFADSVFMALSLIALGFSIYIWYVERQQKNKKTIVEHYPAINAPTE